MLYSITPPLERASKKPKTKNQKLLLKESFRRACKNMLG